MMRAALSFIPSLFLCLFTFAFYPPRSGLPSCAPLRENGGSFSSGSFRRRRVENRNLMRWSQFFIPTLREDPADAEVVSHRMLLRAGYIRQLGAGIYSFLPLGWRVAQRAMKVIREEMD